MAARSSYLLVLAIVTAVILHPSDGLTTTFAGFQGLCLIPKLRVLLSFCSTTTTEPTATTTTPNPTTTTTTTCAYTEWSTWAEVRFARKSCASGRAIEYGRKRAISKGDKTSCPELLTAKTVKCPLSSQAQIAELQKALGGNFGKGLGGTKSYKPVRKVQFTRSISWGRRRRRRRSLRPSLLPPGPTVTREIALVLDASGSVGRVQFDQMIDNLANLLGNLCYQFTVTGRPSDVRLALIVYSSTVRQVFSFVDSSRSHLTLAAIKQAILAAKSQYNGGLTATGPALRYCYNNLFPRATASTDNVKRRILLVTDGRANHGENPIAIARKLFVDKGVQVFPVGVGRNIDFQQLRDVRQLPGSNTDFLPLLLLNDYSSLGNIAGLVQTHLQQSQPSLTCVRNFFK